MYMVWVSTTASSSWLYSYSECYVFCGTSVAVFFRQTFFGLETEKRVARDEEEVDTKTLTTEDLAGLFWHNILYRW